MRRSWLDSLADAAGKATPGERSWNDMDQLVTTGDATDPYRDAAETDYSRTPHLEFKGARLIETDSGFYPPRENDRPLFALCSPERIRALVDVARAAEAWSDAMSMCEHDGETTHTTKCPAWNAENALAEAIDRLPPDPHRAGETE